VAHAPAAQVSAAFADQNKRNMGIVDEITGRALGRHVGNAVMFQQGCEMLDDLAPHAGMAMGEIGDLSGDDGAHLAGSQQWADAAGMAEHDAARQQALRGAIDHRIGQRPDTGVDAVGAHARLDDARNDATCLLDAR
jgi:hypothetical protein